MDNVCFTDDDVVNDLIHLRNGDTKHLTGFSFGDEFDYNTFKISGSIGYKKMYRLKNSKDISLNYLFNGQGNRFSGFYASYGDNFFGIKMGEDALDKVINALGEPDKYHDVNDDNELAYAEYYFTEAILHISIRRDRRIRYISYEALESTIDKPQQMNGQTEFFVDFQSGGKNVHCNKRI
jgi:hypothetical protein